MYIKVFRACNYVIFTDNAIYSQCSFNEYFDYKGKHPMSTTSTGKADK